MKTHPVIEELKNKKLKLVTAESCTAGMLSSYIAELPGSGDVFFGGFVTYHDESKTKLLDVDAGIISEKGAISPETATAMAQGALDKSAADIAVAITGIAGPDGVEGKPVGLVYIAVNCKGKTRVIANQITGNHHQVKTEAVSRAIRLLTTELT